MNTGKACQLKEYGLDEQFYIMTALGIITFVKTLLLEYVIDSSLIKILIIT